jgi:drug/metabolite transporter (DMT)-like permease
MANSAATTELPPSETPVQEVTNDNDEGKALLMTAFDDEENGVQQDGTEPFCSDMSHANATSGLVKRLEIKSRSTSSLTSLESTSSSEHPSNSADAKNQKRLAALLVGFFASNAASIHTSKTLPFPWQWVTLLQFVASALCAYVRLAVFDAGRARSSTSIIRDSFPSSNDQDIWKLTILLASFYVGGRVTFILALRRLDVSTVVTVRATEPAFALVLGACMLPNEHTSLRAMICLIPVIGGAIIASSANVATVSKGEQDDEINSIFGAIWIVLACNCLFAFRTIWAKFLKVACPMLESQTLMFQLCILGSIIQTVMCLIMMVAAPEPEKEEAELVNSQSAHIPSWRDPAQLFMLTLNALSSYSFLQFALIIMDEVEAVTYSVCHACSRPITCVIGWICFGGASVEGITGAVMSTLGTLLYARAKQPANQPASNEKMADKI